MNTIRKFEISMKMMTPKFRRVFPTALLLFFTIPLMIPVAEALWLDVPQSGTRCVSEEIQSNIVVLGDYLILSENLNEFPTIFVKVTSPYGNNLHHSENVTQGQFAFTTQESGNYLVCFTADPKSHGNKNVSINLDWKTGIAAKDWAAIAKKDKIEGVELEIKKLEGAVEAIHENIIYLRHREAEMRDVSEKTNSRVALYSVISLGICIAVSGIQVVYLKQYFEKKKLI